MDEHLIEEVSEAYPLFINSVLSNDSASESELDESEVCKTIT